MAPHNNKYNNGNNSQNVSVGAWIMTAIMLSAFFPIGLVLLLVNLSKIGVFSSIKKFLEAPSSHSGARDKKANTGTPNAKATSTSKKKTSNTKETSKSKNKTSNKASKTPDMRETTFHKALKKSRSKRIFQSISGFILAIIGLTVFSVSAGTYGFTLSPEALLMTSLGLGTLFGGGALCLAAYLRRKNEKLYKRYFAIIGDSDSADIGRLSMLIHCSYKNAVKDLQDMIDEGFYGSHAYIDRSNGVLYPSGGKHTEEFIRTERKTPKEENTASVSESKSEYQRILMQIREVNERIDDTEVSAKIARIEYTTASIFTVVEHRPEKLPQIKTFMNYYLPTTCKLLDSYAQFEDQGIEGENLKAAKTSIESIMDNLVAGFERQLDSLFKDDAMDVSSDIEVLETMMAKDGYTGGGFEEDFFGSSAAQCKPTDM